MRLATCTECRERHERGTQYTTLERRSRRGVNPPEVGGLTPLRDLRVPVLRRLRLNLPTANPHGKNKSTVW